MKRILALFFAAPVIALTSLACSSANGPSLDPAHTNCNIVCEQANMCSPTKVVVDSCENSCDSKSSSDDSYKASVTDCATCVNGKTCTDSASCVDNCLATVTSS
jgi:hypothetical protein